METSETKQNRAASAVIQTAVILFGLTVYAAGVVLFILPLDMIAAGTTGLGLMAQHFFGIPLSGFVAVFNIAMFGLGWLELGKKFAATTLLATFYYPFILDRLTALAGDFVFTTDPMLCAIFAGIMIGFALGFVIRSGASTGGMDIPPLVLNKWFHLPVSATMMVFDLIILAVQAAFSPLQQCLYGIVMVIVYTVVLDKVLIFGSTRTEVKIISQHADEIREAIFSQLDRGVTILHGEGGYSRNSEQVLLSVISNRQLPKLEKIAHLIDPTCFMIVSHVTEVSGRGFSLEKDYKEEG